MTQSLSVEPGALRKSATRAAELAEQAGEVRSFGANWLELSRSDAPLFLTLTAAVAELQDFVDDNYEQLETITDRVHLLLNKSAAVYIETDDRNASRFNSAASGQVI